MNAIQTAFDCSRVLKISINKEITIKKKKFKKKILHEQIERKWLHLKGYCTLTTINAYFELQSFLNLTQNLI